MEPENQKPNHLKSVQTGAILSQTIWNPDKNVSVFELKVTLSTCLQDLNFTHPPNPMQKFIALAYLFLL